MGIGNGRNAWWNDVLENGPSSPAAVFFDIDWTPVKEELHAKLLLPILGDQYGRVLERGELKLAFHDGAADADVLRHHAADQPAPGAARVRGCRSSRSPSILGADNPALHEFLSIVTLARRTCRRTPSSGPERMAERQREKEVARDASGRLVAETPVVGEQIELALRSFNGEPGRPESFDQLHELLESQPYRLAYWRTASHEINYRRFFDVNTLAGLRVEDRKSSPRRTSCSRRCSATASSTRCASIIPTACSIRRATSRCCRTWPRGAWGIERQTDAAAAARARSTSSPRRSCRAASALPRAWARARHDRLQLPQRSQRPLRRRRARAAHAPDLRQAHRPSRSRSTTWSTRASG